MKKIANFSKWILRITIILALIYDISICAFSGIAGGIAVLALTFVVDFVNKKGEYFQIH